MRGGITLKIALPLVLVLGVSMGVLVYFNSKLVLKTIGDEVKAHLRDVGKNAVTTVELGVESMKKLENALLQAHKMKIESVVESALRTVEGFYEAFKKGEITEEEAKDLARKTLGAMRYEGGTGYIFVTDYDGVMLVHVKKSLIGKNLIDLKDPNGVYLIRRLIEAAKEGGGFVEYMWPKPGEETPQPKLSYAVGFEPWRWMIGTGVYIDDVKKQVSDYERALMETLRNNLMKIKLGESSYPAIVAEDGTVVMYVKRELEGRKVTFKDAKTGENLLEKFKSHKNDFVEYYYPKPESDGIYKKLAYVGYVPEKKWFVLMTVYEDEIYGPTKRISVLFVWMIVGGMVLFVFLIWLVLRVTLVKLLGRVESFAKEVGSGNLTVKLEIDSNDEIGRLAAEIFRMKESIRSMVDGIKDATEHAAKKSEDLDETAESLSSSVDEVASSIDTIVDRANNVAAAVEETTSGVEEVASSAQMVSKTAEELSAQSASLKDAVENGEEALETIIDRIRSISSESKNAVEKVKSLSDSTQNIESIVETINSIAEQTNLLALNAAIEAARAGEAGKGFAVVAEEIRKLAEESRRSTEKIARILAQIRSEADAVSDITRRLVEMINDVSEQSGNISDVFRSIKDQTVALDSMTSNLAASAQQQSAASQEISAAMDNATKAVNEVVDELERIKSQISELSGLRDKLVEVARSMGGVVETLEGAIGRFKTE